MKEKKEELSLTEIGGCHQATKLMVVIKVYVHQGLRILTENVQPGRSLAS